VQVDPIKPTFKAHGTKRLKFKYDHLLLSFAFNFNLRHYTEAREMIESGVDPAAWRRETERVVGRCRLPASKPVLKA